MAKNTKALSVGVAAATDVVVRPSDNMPVPEFLQGYQGPSGLEGLSRQDFKLPVLKVLQGMSPELRKPVS